MAHAPVRIKDITRAPARTYIQDFQRVFLDDNLSRQYRICWFLVEGLPYSLQSLSDLALPSVKSQTFLDLDFDDGTQLLVGVDCSHRLHTDQIFFVKNFASIWCAFFYIRIELLLIVSYAPPTEFCPSPYYLQVICQKIKIFLTKIGTKICVRYYILHTSERASGDAGPGPGGYAPPGLDNVGDHVRISLTYPAHK